MAFLIIFPLCHSYKLLPKKNHIALYHCFLYADAKLLEWFKAEYPKHDNTKLDMGKSCIRFKKPFQIPLDLIAALCRKVSCDD